MMGQLKTKTLGGNLETQTYDYNIRGWLLGMNRTYVKDLNSPALAVFRVRTQHE
jgi:hypothetical protein